MPEGVWLMHMVVMYRKTKFADIKKAVRLFLGKKVQESIRAAVYKNWSYSFNTCGHEGPQNICMNVSSAVLDGNTSSLIEVFIEDPFCGFL